MSETDAVKKCEDILRGLAFYLGVGGYNSDTFDPDVFDRKIRDGIDMFVAPWMKDAKRYRALRVRGAAPNGTRHFEERLALVATNLDVWVDALLNDGLGIAPSDAAEGIAATRANLARRGVTHDAGAVMMRAAEIAYEEWGKACNSERTSMFTVYDRLRAEAEALRTAAPEQGADDGWRPPAMAEDERCAYCGGSVHDHHDGCWRAPTPVSK